MKRFIHGLQHRSEADAAYLLVRLRMGDGVADLSNIESLRSGEYVRPIRAYWVNRIDVLKGRRRSMCMSLRLLCTILSPALKSLGCCTSANLSRPMLARPTTRMQRSLALHNNQCRSVPIIFPIECEDTATLHLSLCSTVSECYYAWQNQARALFC